MLLPGRAAHHFLNVFRTRQCCKGASLPVPRQSSSEHSISRFLSPNDCQETPGIRCFDDEYERISLLVPRRQSEGWNLGVACLLLLHPLPEQGSVAKWPVCYTLLIFGSRQCCKVSCLLRLANFLNKTGLQDGLSLSLRSSSSSSVSPRPSYQACVGESPFEHVNDKTAG